MATKGAVKQLIDTTLRKFGNFNSMVQKFPHHLFVIWYKNLLADIIQGPILLSQKLKMEQLPKRRMLCLSQKQIR